MHADGAMPLARSGPTTGLAGKSFRASAILTIGSTNHRETPGRGFLVAAPTAKRRTVHLFDRHDSAEN